MTITRLDMDNAQSLARIAKALERIAKQLEVSNGGAGTEEVGE